MVVWFCSLRKKSDVNIKAVINRYECNVLKDSRAVIVVEYAA